MSRYAVEVLIGEEWSRLKHIFDDAESARTIGDSARSAPIVRDMRVVRIVGIADQHSAIQNEEAK